MAKKKRTSPNKFNFKKIAALHEDPEKMYIPEFNFAWGDDEAETAELDPESPVEETAETEDAYVIVHPLTVRDKSILGSYTSQLGLSEISSECVIAALASRDDAGNLVWGDSRHKAIEFLSDLPEHLRPVVTRIATKALELTGRQGNAGVKDAEKN